MDFFALNVCPTDQQFCFIDEPPEGTFMYTHRMSRGFAMGDKYPKNARVILDQRRKGRKLPSLIGNTDSFLIVCTALKDVLEATGVPMECLHFSLLDSKKKLLSKDYYIVNPIGTFDCLHQKKSRIQYEGDEVVDVHEMVLDAKKVAKGPDLFRVKEKPRVCVVSHRLLDKLKALKPTNVYVEELKQA